MNPPPFLVSFASQEQFLKALPDDVRQSYGDAFINLVSKGLPPVVSLRCLATLFGYSAKFVGAMFSKTERYYRTFTIPKGNKRRTINAPKVALKVIQKWIAYHLAKNLTFESSVFGFIEGRSAVAAAAVHCGSEWIYSIDIENFFPSTPLPKVKKALKSLGYSERGAELIAKFCCYAGALSQGSPASPVLSNLVFSEVDRQLVEIARTWDLRLTRYADDVVFSGVAAFPVDLKAMVRNAIETAGWAIADTKERFSRRPNRLKVHGLLVHGIKPRLTKGYRNKIRAFKYLVEAKKVQLEHDQSVIRGHLSYARSVEAFGKRQLDETSDAAS